MGTKMTTLSLALMANLIGTAAPQEMTLVKDGKPAASIVLAKQPSRAAQLAAFELREHLRRISGAELPIVADDTPAAGTRVLVGESAATRALGLANPGFAPQEYLVKFLPGTLALMGRDKADTGRVEYDYLANPGAVETWPGLYDEQGTMYAVYDFLEKHCGVHWINPTDFGTIHPSNATVTATGDELRRKPFMAFRGGSAAWWNSSEYEYGGGLWRQGTPGAAAYMAAAYPRLSARHPNPTHRDGLPLRAQNRLFQYRMKAGGDQRQCNHSFYCYYERFLKKDHANFESLHPEYFAQGYQGDEPPQLCYSNPATVTQAVADARDYFDHGGYRKTMSCIGSPGYQWGKDYFALEPMDNSSFCRCPVCAPQYETGREAQSVHSTYWFRFVNAVAREVKKSHPDKFISTLAYGTHEGLPTGFDLEPNVTVHFCLSANRVGAACTELLKTQFARLEQWRAKQPDTPMCLWLYNCFPKMVADSGHFNCFPGCFAHEAKRQFAAFQKLGIQGIFHCGFDGEVENYVTYKLMDDPSLDVDQLLDRYFSAYGEAAKPLRAWYDLAEQRYADPALLPLEGGKPYEGHQTVDLAWKRLGDVPTMARLGALMDEGKAKATGDAAKRLELWDLGTWAYMRAGRDNYLERQTAPIPSATATRVASVGGDPNKVDWDKAGDLGSKWYLRGGGDPSKRVFRGRVCHDGEFFYLEMVEENVTAKQLVVSTLVGCFDCWEPLFARQRAQPFRQYMVGPTGLHNEFSYGEINWRQCVPMHETGIRIACDTSGNRWVARVSWPLATLLDKPVKPGDTIYMNILRTSNPTLAAEADNSFGIDTWVSHCSVREVDRLGEVRLAQ